jgi:hypothetical protein
MASPEAFAILLAFLTDGLRWNINSLAEYSYNREKPYLKGVSNMANTSAQSQANDRETTQAGVRFPLWISIVVILGALLSITGAVISKVNPTLLTNGSTVTEAVRVYADYTFARDLALAVMLLLFLGIRARRMLAGIMILVAFVQLIDIANDLARGDWLLIPGLLVFAIVFLLGAWRLLGREVLDAKNWREW